MEENIPENFLARYFSQLSDALNGVSPDLIGKAYSLVEETYTHGGKIIIFGNGGSSSIANHAAVDFVKAAGVRAITLSDSSMLTCLTNDFGYENCAPKFLEYYADPRDLVILISSSGESENIIKAAQQSVAMELSLITFSGFSTNNRLSKYGNVRFWCNSDHYNTIENVHQIWLLAIIDFFISKKV